MNRIITALGGLALAALAAGSASAQSATADPEAGSAPAASAATSAPFGAMPALEESDMAKATARQDISMIAENRQASSVANSSVNGNSVTGDISFADSAFQSANGLIVVNANTGNNVAMNASMAVNLIMAAPPQP